MMILLSLFILFLVLARSFHINRSLKVYTRCNTKLMWWNLRHGTRLVCGLNHRDFQVLIQSRIHVTHYTIQTRRCGLALTVVDGSRNNNFTFFNPTQAIPARWHDPERWSNKYDPEAVGYKKDNIYIHIYTHINLWLQECKIIHSVHWGDCFGHFAASKK